MGDFLAEVAARAARPESLAHRISLRLSLTEASPFVTEAGDDAFFYNALAIRLRISNGLEFFVADGRPKVLSTLQILTDMKRIDKVYAAVDRDFNYDDPTTLFDGHCLVLDLYSFENYFLDIDYLFQIGATMLSLEPGSVLQYKWRSIVEKFHSGLRDSLRYEHAIGLWCRINSKNCNLNNFNCRKHIHIADDGSLIRAADLADRFKVETNADLHDLNESMIAECLVTLDSKPLSSVIRGHYFWDLFIEVLNKFRLLVDEKLKAAGSSRSRTRSNIEQRHAIEASISLVDVPSIIKDFFEVISTQRGSG